MERAELRALLGTLPNAEVRGRFVFLADPTWPEVTRAKFARTLEEAEMVDASFGWLSIPTGGTSGELRFVRHDQETVGAAVDGFTRHFRVERVNAVGVLPMHHVSGLMAWLRCAGTGGRYLAQDWKRLQTGDWPRLTDERDDWFLSLVPTQLQRLLELPGGAEFLRRFRAVFLGGAPAWPALTDQAAEQRIPVSLSYGMSETAAMVAAQLPEEFLCGYRDAGRVMPHAQVKVDVEAGGVLRINGESVFRGYFPGFREPRTFLTEDLGEVLPGGRVRVLGRRDAVIITGGEKVAPTEVEEALRATGAFSDVAVIGVPDPEWGQAVVACYPAGGLRGEAIEVRGRLSLTLARYKQPKRYVPIAEWPRNAQGKVNRAELLRAVEASHSV